jgi:sigma-B regulation protein RsbU (phosphoserine phosphatase)
VTAISCGHLEAPGRVPTDGDVVTDTAATRPGLASLAAAVEALPDGVAVLDVDQRICYLNSAGAGLLGRPAGTLIGRAITDALSVPADEVAAALRRARDTGAPVTWTARSLLTGPSLTATAVAAGDLLQLTLRPGGDPSGHPAVPALVRPRAESDLEADRSRLRFLADVTEAMTTSLDVEKGVSRLAELLVPRLADWAIVTVAGEDGRPDAEGRAHADPARRADVDVYRDGRLRVTSPDNPMVTALLTGRPVQLVLDEARMGPTLQTEEVREAWRRLDSRTATIVPLRARGETFGALAMMNTGSRPPHTAAEVATATEVARRASMSLDNARLYGRQLEIAETLQRSLLTPPAQTDPRHLQIAVRYRPAASHQAVGGDWYDSFLQADGATELVIGDVAGHSVEASAAMSAMRSMLRALATDRPGSPAQILTRLDRVLAALGGTTLTTVLLARVERPQDAPGLRRLRWSSAGHPPPLLLRADGRVQILETAPERLMGTDWAGVRTDHEVLLHPGDTALLVTDGIIEQGRWDIDRGTARLCSVLVGLAGLPVDELCDRLLDGIVDGRPDDDIALLALRLHPLDDVPAG